MKDKKQIIVISDKARCLAEVRDLFSAGFNVIMCEKMMRGGESAIPLTNIAAVLIDFSCAGADGTVRRISDACAAEKIPVMAVISRDKPEEGELALDSGADEIIEAPFNHRVAANRICSLIQKSEREKRYLKDKAHFDTIISEFIFVYEVNVDDSTCVLLHTNDYAEKNIPYKLYHSTGFDIKPLMHPHDIECFTQFCNKDNIIKAYESGKKVLRMQTRIKNNSGDWVWTETTMYLIMESVTGKPTGVAYVKTIGDRKKLEKRAQIDGVSKLFNRVTAEERISEAIKSGCGRSAFFLYDVDDFKRVNDTLGHAEGDRLISLISKVLRNNFSNKDIIGRIGGDEFVAFLNDFNNENYINRLAARTIADIEQISSGFDRRVKISSSLGIVVPGSGQFVFDDLYRAADRALYSAKESGKNCYKICRI